MAQGVIAGEADAPRLISTVETIETNTREFPSSLPADAGYWSERNDEYLFEEGIDAYVGTGRQPHHETAEPAP